MTGSLYFTKEFAGHQRRLYQSAFGQVLGLVVLLGISVLLWVMDYGLWVIATDYLFVNST
jgi:hypothetical protein